MEWAAQPGMSISFCGESMTKGIAIVSLFHLPAYPTRHEKVSFATTCLQSAAGMASPDITECTGSTDDAQILKRIQGVRTKRSMATSFSAVCDPHQTTSRGRVISAGPNCVPKKDRANFPTLLEFGHTMARHICIPRIHTVIHRDLGSYFARMNFHGRGGFGPRMAVHF